ncbi:MAG: hypothetical protein DSZ06_03975 [Sulfurospirillum sp.]|nr:MAG: hypothetical protein DSZ06_03975 [Sulfurospirillum sp.]
MKHFIKIVTILVFTLTSLNAFEIFPFPKNASLTENFSTNCLQMTQSQQILKAYIMVGLKSNFQNPKENLKKAIVDYDIRAHKVKEYFQDLLKKSNKNGADSAIKAFDEAMNLWQENKKMLELTPSKKNGLIIRKNFLKMINKLLDGTKPLATPDLELISLTGKLCRKPMEITIDYLLRIWGVDMPDFKQNVEKTINNFHKNLDTLSKSSLNNKESLALLQKAKKQFRYFEFMYKAKSHFIPSLLSKKADDNFKIIRDIKKIYKQRAK